MKKTEDREERSLKDIYLLIKQKQLQGIRQALYDRQGGVCPLLNTKLDIDSFVVDHQHRLNKQQPIGENGAGLIRGCIQRQANIIEGKIFNSWRRYGMDKYNVSLPDFLRNLADYLEQENLPMVHPSEQEKPKIIQKSCYNKLIKAHDKELPPYRTSPKGKNIQKLTKPLKALFEKYNIEVQYY